VKRNVALLDRVMRKGMAYEILEFLDIIWDGNKRSFLVKTSWAGFSEMVLNIFVYYFCGQLF
jgi:hypothetical protein